MRFDGPGSNNFEDRTGGGGGLNLGGGLGMILPLIASRFGIVGILVLLLGYCALNSLGGGGIVGGGSGESRLGQVNDSSSQGSVATSTPTGSSSAVSSSASSSSSSPSGVGVSSRPASSRSSTSSARSSSSSSAAVVCGDVLIEGYISTEHKNGDYLKLG